MRKENEFKIRYYFDPNSIDIFSLNLNFYLPMKNLNARKRM